MRLNVNVFQRSKWDDHVTVHEEKSLRGIVTSDETYVEVSIEIN